MVDQPQRAWLRRGPRDDRDEDDARLAGAGDHFTAEDIYSMWFNLRRMKNRIDAFEDGDLRPEDVTKIATDLGVPEQEVVNMNRRMMMGGDGSLNTPMRNGDRIVGYLSVRTKPTEDEVRAAEGLYAMMRQEAQSGRLAHVLERGKLVRAGAWSQALRRLTPGLRGKILWLTMLAAAIPELLQWVGVPAWASVVCALAVAVGTGLWIWQLMGAPLYRVVAQANRVAAGDLSENILLTESGPVGELQQALAQVQLTTRTVVRDVRHEVGNLRGGTQEIAMGNEDMSNRVESQASNIEETAASMEQINGTVQQSAASAREGARLAEATAEVAQRSHDAVLGVAQAMAAIREGAWKYMTCPADPPPSNPPVSTC